MAKYRKRPVVIDAVQFTGGNIDEIRAFAGENVLPDIDGQIEAIATLEGFKPCPSGYWIIKGVAGEFYPCEPDIFAATYEPVSSEEEA